MFKAILKTNFARQFMMVFSGTALAQMVAFALSPLVSRIYTPEDFGILGLYSAMIGFMSAIVGFNYQIAIVVPEKNSEAQKLVSLVFALITIKIIILSLTLFFFVKPIFQFFEATALIDYWWLLPIGLFLDSAARINYYWCLREKRYDRIGTSAVIKATINNGGKVIGGLFYPKAITMILCTISAFAVYYLLLQTSNYRNLRKEVHRLTLGKSRLYIKELYQTLLKYYDYLLYRTPQYALLIISQILPTFLLAAWFNSAAVGAFALAKTVISAPQELLGKSVYTVFFPKITQMHNKGQRIGPIIVKATGILFLIALVPFGLIGAFGEPIFTLVFGHQWGTAGIYAQWMSIGLIFDFANRGISASLPVLRKQNFSLVVQICLFVLQFISIYVGATYFHSDIWAMMLYGLSYGVVNILYILYFLVFLKRNNL